MKVQRYVAIFDSGRTTVNGAPPKYGRYCERCNKVPYTLRTWTDSDHHITGLLRVLTVPLSSQLAL